ncbi:MAG: hypothetical protein R3F59_22275 [Myxococcota bacterium]
MVLISGPARDEEKRRLVEWLCRRAHRAGAANWCKATFAPQKAPGQALQEMGVDYLRTAGLRRSLVEQRVVEFLARHGSADLAEAEVLTELLCPATRDDLDDGVRPVRLTRPREYYAGTANTMRRLASERPLVAWFDDVQYGLHGLGLAIDVLATQDVDPFPGLVLLTMRNEGLDEESDEARRLRRLLDMSGVRTVGLGPLPPGAHRELVQGLLGLDESLAARVEERTGGNPLFAVQLVGSWVQDGTLEVGERGFRLKPGARAELPDDLHAVWAGHVARILEEFEPRAQEYLERAACLGQEITQVEWRRACDDPEGVFGDRFPGDEPLRAALVDRLLVHRLVVGTRARWSFVHGMLRESLERTARQARRWAQHHEACATMLSRYAEDPRVAERLGRHLLEAGQPEQAVAPLLRGVEHRLVTVGPQPAVALLGTVGDAMRAAALPETDARWGELWTLTARTLQDSGDLDGALASAARASEGAARFGWHQVAFAAAEAEARLLIRLRRPRRGRRAARAPRAGGRAGRRPRSARHRPRRAGRRGAAHGRCRRGQRPAAAGHRGLGEALEARASSTLRGVPQAGVARLGQGRRGRRARGRRPRATSGPTRSSRSSAPASPRRSASTGSAGWRSPRTTSYGRASASSARCRSTRRSAPSAGCLAGCGSRGWRCARSRRSAGPTRCGPSWSGCSPSSSGSTTAGASPPPTACSSSARRSTATGPAGTRRWPRPSSRGPRRRARPRAPPGSAGSRARRRCRRARPSAGARRCERRWRCSARWATPRAPRRWSRACAQGEGAASAAIVGLR